MNDVVAARAYITEIMLTTVSSGITASCALQFAIISWYGVRM